MTRFQLVWEGVMSKSYVSSVPVALGLVILLHAPFEAAAKSRAGGLGVHHGGSHSHQHGGFRSHRHGGLQHRPLHGYVSTAPYYGPDYFGEAPLQMFVAPSEPPHSLDCKRSQSTVTVPSEDGGTRQIIVTRC